jgi:hypothetical protein
VVDDTLVTNIASIDAKKKKSSSYTHLLIDCFLKNVLMVKIICDFSCGADYATMIDGISFAIEISEERKLMSLFLLMKFALYDTTRLCGHFSRQGRIMRTL